ncbi:hypothetical protein ROBYS_27680 [Roseobacter sp. OBYS 0001]|nr:hypothetical protein ROBYS_27680 [Roseobacter sp. OBYS 0001]
MPKTAGEINASKAAHARSWPEGEVWKIFPLENRNRCHYLDVMNYILAILLPPLSILLTGRPILAIIVFVIWIPALIFSGGLTHPMFIILAWALIFHAREDRRQRF